MQDSLQWCGIKGIECTITLFINISDWGKSSSQSLWVGGKHNSWHAMLVCVVYRSTRSSFVRDFSNGCKCLEPFSCKWNLIQMPSMRNGETIPAFSHWKIYREWFHMLFLNTNRWIPALCSNKNPFVVQFVILGSFKLLNIVSFSFFFFFLEAFVSIRDLFQKGFNF